MRFSCVIAVGVQAAFAVGAVSAGTVGEVSDGGWQVNAEVEHGDRLTPLLARREIPFALFLQGTAAPSFRVPQSLFAMQTEQSVQESLPIQPAADLKIAAEPNVPATEPPGVGGLVLVFLCAAAGAALCRALPQ